MNNALRAGPAASLPIGALLLIGGLLAPSAWAQGLPNQDRVCRADEPRMDKEGYLRSLMLDLLGTVPTPEDYARLEGEDDVPEWMIEEMLGSDAFVQRAVRHHRALLWNNVDNVTLTNFRTAMRRSRMRDGSYLYWRTTPAETYRGGPVPCDDVPATFDDQGRIEFRTDAEGNRIEGYVRVEPYWAPGTELKVCAFDAQATQTSPNGTDCRTNNGLRDPGCGCGPNLNLCRYGATDRAVTQAMAQDVELRVAQVIREDRPYTELFTGRTAFVNGPLVQFLRERVEVPAGVRMTPLAYDLELLPKLDYGQDAERFVQVELDPEHAGILTSPAFLLRFQTNRARAARFYDAFLCQPFSPPPGGLPTGEEPHPDLQRREGCKYCHALLEPAAAHWGRWDQQGAGFLDPEAFPAEREDCRQCGMTGQLCSRECRNFYITQTLSPLEDRYIGMLEVFSFLKDQHIPNVDFGPKLLAQKTVVDDRFPNCTARRAMEGLFGRELNAEEEAWLSELARRFVASQYSYKELVKAIVTSPVYRRVR